MRTLVAVYDLAWGPVSFDFVTWLARARLEQQRLGVERLHVLILPHEQGLGGFARDWGGHDATSTWWRLWHVVVGACPLAQATVTLGVQSIEDIGEGNEDVCIWRPDERAQRSYLLGPIVDAARAGESIPMLSATEQARKFVRGWAEDWSRTVTITVRRSSQRPGAENKTAPDAARDSNGPEWSRFRDWLCEQGWDVIWIEDTFPALYAGAIGDFAALSIDLRAALYQAARMNFFVNSGPQALCWHTGAPFMAFNSGQPAEPWHRQWVEGLHIPIGGQLPWATPAQRWIYAPDRFEVMADAFRFWQAELADAQRASLPQFAE